MNAMKFIAPAQTGGKGGGNEAYGAFARVSRCALGRFFLVLDVFTCPRPYVVAFDHDMVSADRSGTDSWANTHLDHKDGNQLLRNRASAFAAGSVERRTLSACTTVRFR